MLSEIGQLESLFLNVCFFLITALVASIPLLVGTRVTDRDFFVPTLFDVKYMYQSCIIRAGFF